MEGSFWRANWQREIEGAYLYRRLSENARTTQARKALAQMAEQEEKHASIWEKRARAAGLSSDPPRPDLRIHLIEWLSRWLGSEAIFGLLINDEVNDIATYAEQARRTDFEPVYQQVLRDETSHARALASLRQPNLNNKSEPWHQSAGAAGWLRSVVYGFNDGLTANFGLVMGVVGASVSGNVVLVAGFAGLLADALSMAASGFLAARSSQEVRQHHLALEQAELILMPDEERQELADYFAQKGLTRHDALNVASRLIENPEAALTQLAREELGIDPETVDKPLQEGIVTGFATGLGAVIPLIPFLFLPSNMAIWAGVAISMLAHFLVGASRAVFTGRPALRSGLEMFSVGMGVALFTYLLGGIFGVRL